MHIDFLIHHLRNLFYFFFSDKFSEKNVKFLINMHSWGNLSVWENLAAMNKHQQMGEKMN